MRVKPLREASIRELRLLLDEEVALWDAELAWDFGEVRAAVAGGIERGGVPGRFVSDGVRAAAYCYYMMDAGRAIIGSIFAGREHRGRGLEEDLVEAVIADARSERGSGRVECQTLFCTASGANTRFGTAGFAQGARHYMLRELHAPLPAPDPVLPGSMRVKPLGREDLPAAAEIVYRSHVGTIDAALNLTYSTPATCRAFVETLVLRAGCGRFEPDASRLVEGPKGPAGVLLASRLARANGHVCQVSVVPEAQGQGLGAFLMMTALRAFRAQGLASVTLSVTVANARAHRLYTRLGFRTRREFAAHAWLRPPARIELPA